MTETVAEIVAAHRTQKATPEQTVARSYARIRAYADPATFITLRDEADALAEARALAAKDASALPLLGVPVAVKDNIDVAGLDTTDACPSFKYRAERDATVVRKLREAGAIVIGKTNLDQFATGLVGVRSPYGVPRNPHNAELIPGGSSSGSAVAVAAGLVPLALGTDTAGSGRVPAMINNIVGLKPSLGMLSSFGLVPACRTLDTISIFALTVDDTWTALEAVTGYDERDAYSRHRPPGRLGAAPAHMRLGIPAKGQALFFGDARMQAHYEAALERLRRLGAELIETDIEPFYETARLLYEGPWVAERFLAVRSLVESKPDALHPITREIVLGGRKPTAADAFTALYRLEELRGVAARTFAKLDALALPTAPTIYSVKELAEKPIELNSRLGTYTNFVNLLDLCGIAVPAALEKDGRNFGITLLAPAGHDAQLAAIGRAFHADTKLPLGALGVAQPPLAPLPAVAAQGEIALAVVGAHLSGLPLNHELTALGARYLETTKTAADYRLFALPNTTPPKPGLLRVSQGAGAAIEIEIWALSAEAFGRFVGAIPAPLGIGTLALSDGRGVKGFLVEAEAVKGARDVSEFGGWRAFTRAAK